MAINDRKTKQVHERKLPWFRSSHLSKSASVVPVHNSVRQIIVINSQMEWAVSIQPVTPSWMFHIAWATAILTSCRHASSSACKGSITWCMVPDLPLLHYRIIISLTNTWIPSIPSSSVPNPFFWDTKRSATDQGRPLVSVDEDSHVNVVLVP